MFIKRLGANEALEIAEKLWQSKIPKKTEFDFNNFEEIKQPTKSRL